MLMSDETMEIVEQDTTEFFNSVYPVISSGKKTKIIIVSTPNGMNLFYKLWMDSINKKNDYVPFEIHWSNVPGRDEKWKEETIRNTSLRQLTTRSDFCSLDSDTTLIRIDSCSTDTCVTVKLSSERKSRVDKNPRNILAFICCV